MVTSQETKPDTTNIHTPLTLVNLFARALKTPADTRILLLRGVYQAHGKKSYNDYYYDRLKDEEGVPSLTVKIPTSVRQTLTDENVYIFKGFLERRIQDDGTIDLVFVVADCVSRERRALTDHQLQSAEIQRLKSSQGYRDLDNVLRRMLYAGTKPALCLIYGSTGVVDEDVNRALKEAAACYQLHERRINLSSRADIIQELTQADNSGHTAIAIVRGGGTGLELFDDPDIARIITSLHTIFISAIGHAQDVTLVERIADKSFSTPTALGAYLRETVETCQQDIAQSRARLVQELERAHQSQLQQMRDQNAALIKELEIQRTSQRPVPVADNWLTRLMQWFRTLFRPE